MTRFVRASRLYDPEKGPRPHVRDAAQLRWERDTAGRELGNTRNRESVRLAWVSLGRPNG